MQLTVAVSAVLDRLRAVLTRHSDAPVALLLPRETFLLTDWGRHRRQQPEEYSVRTLPYASTVKDSTNQPQYIRSPIRFGQRGKIPAQIPIFPAKSLVHVMKAPQDRLSTHSRVCVCGARRGGATR